MPQPRLPFCEIQYMKRRRFRGIQLAPSQRHGDRRTASGARRIRSHGCCLPIVAKIVEIDSILARRLRHLRHIKLRFVSLELERKTMCELLDCRPLVIRPNGNNNVQAFAAGAFHKTHEPQFRELSLEFPRRFHQSFPLDCGVGIEIEDDTIGMFERLIVRAPGMNFKHAHLGQPNQPLAGINGEVVLFVVALAISNRNSLNSCRQPKPNVLLEKTRPAVAVRAPHNAQRAIGNVWQQILSNRFVVFGELLLCHTALRIQHLVRMRDCQALCCHVLHPCCAFLAAGGTLCDHCAAFSLPRRTMLCSVRCNSLLPHYFIRRFVLTQSLECRLPHQIVACPG